MMEEGRAAALLCATGSKVGLKRGSWTAEEDMRLIAYINKYGYPNWRALPEQAGLLRCGKSCRLRWINYLRPGLKRGNFTAEENETIIKLHAALGNKYYVVHRSQLRHHASVVSITYPSSAHILLYHTRVVALIHWTNCSILH
uniref:Uncharacterized protein n=1 Tax=Avena sativa TaxID=4498 RepID=A0ACD5UXA3_AVESA